MNHIGVVLLLWLSPLRLEVLPDVAAAWISRDGGRTETAVLQDVTDDLRTRLSISETVQVELVAHNPLVMSVETLGGRTGPFVIMADRDFIRELNQSETEAA